MPILSINTADKQLIEVTLKEGDRVVATLHDNNPFGSQVLLPLIVKILDQQQLKFSDLQGIEVSTGPGSFTGLRVGATVAQTLGFALNIPVNGHIGQPVELRYT